MDLSKITEISLDITGSFIHRIEFWEDKELIDFKEIGKAVSFEEYHKALEAWEKTKKDK